MIAASSKLPEGREREEFFFIFRRSASRKKKLLTSLLPEAGLRKGCLACSFCAPLSFGWGGIRSCNKWTQQPNTQHTMGCVSSVFQYGSYIVDESKPVFVLYLLFLVPSFFCCVPVFCDVCREKEGMGAKWEKGSDILRLLCIPKAVTVRTDVNLATSLVWKMLRVSSWV